jgi:hypothetical protein
MIHELRYPQIRIFEELAGGLSGFVAHQAGAAFAHEPFLRASGGFRNRSALPDLLSVTKRTLVINLP